MFFHNLFSDSYLICPVCSVSTTYSLYAHFVKLFTQPRDKAAFLAVMNRAGTEMHNLYADILQAVYLLREVFVIIPVVAAVIAAHKGHQLCALFCIPLKSSFLVIKCLKAPGACTAFIGHDAVKNSNLFHTTSSS